MTVPTSNEIKYIISEYEKKINSGNKTYYQINVLKKLIDNWNIKLIQTIQKENKTTLNYAKEKLLHNSQE